VCVCVGFRLAASEGVKVEEGQLPGLAEALRVILLSRFDPCHLPCSCRIRPCILDRLPLRFGRGTSALTDFATQLQLPIPTVISEVEAFTRGIRE
jgi:hypothetical protein